MIDGIDGGRDCPKCGTPLVPEIVNMTFAWSCPKHGLIDITLDPFEADQQ